MLAGHTRALLMAAVATLLIVIVGTAHVAEGAPATGEAYWGEHILRGLIQTSPAVAIVVLAGLLLGGMLGFYELDAPSVLFLLAGIAFLAYRFYGHPTRGVSSLLRIKA
jgi:type IV secretory pathway VirB2 component (pilin)